MKVVLTGGVFDDAMGSFALSAPENVLAQFLRERGHEVEGLSSGRQLPTRLDGGVFHANHFGVATYELALAGLRPFVFTSHNPFLVSDFEVPESRLEHALQRATLRAADAIVALSTHEADVLSERYEVQRDQFVVIPNGLDLALYGPSQRSRGEDLLKLLTVGQLVPYKGHSFLLEALAKASLPPWHLTLVSHQSSLRPELETQARQLGFADRLTFAGPFGTAELVDAYRTCDIFVQPSLAECFPVTVLEAMACGAPVVVTDVGGVREEVGEAGIVVPPADAAAIASALERLAADADERRRRAEIGRTLVEHRYDGRAIAQEHLALYSRLSERHGRPAPGRRRAARAATAAYLHRASVTKLIPVRIKRR